MDRFSQGSKNLELVSGSESKIHISWFVPVLDTKTKVGIGVSVTLTDCQFVYPTLYLQWVSIFLVVCAILFYTPRAIWLMAEGGLMKYLAKGATTKIVEDADKKREALLKTFQVQEIPYFILKLQKFEIYSDFATLVQGIPDNSMNMIPLEIG